MKPELGQALAKNYNPKNEALPFTTLGKGIKGLEKSQAGKHISLNPSLL
jgi:hypothetical protein